MSGQSKLTARLPSNRSAFLFLSLIFSLGAGRGTSGSWDLVSWTLCPSFSPKWRQPSQRAVGVVLGVGLSLAILSPGYSSSLDDQGQGCPEWPFAQHTSNLRGSPKYPEYLLMSPPRYELNSISPFELSAWSPFGVRPPWGPAQGVGRTNHHFSCLRGTCEPLGNNYFSGIRCC